MLGSTLTFLEQFDTHDFVIKKQCRPKTCPVCFRIIKFSVTVIRCNNCSLRCHPKCWRDVAHVCSGSDFQGGMKNTRSSDNSEDSNCCQLLIRPPTRLPVKTTGPYIPHPILRLVNEIELKIQPGLYCLRSPDKKEVIQNIITKFKEGKVQNLKIYNVNTLAACLKHYLYNFLRGPPLIPIWHVTKNDEDNFEIEFDALPIPNKVILAFLAIHLKMVAMNPNSRMSLLALAQTFVPVLMKENHKSLAAALFKLLNQDCNLFANQLKLGCR